VSLYGLHEAIESLASVYDITSAKALLIADLPRIKLVLDDVYAVSQPESAVTSAAARVLKVAVEQFPASRRGDRESLALAVSFARHHRDFIRLGPIREGIALVRAVRRGDVDEADIAGWFARRSGNRMSLLPSDLGHKHPLRGLVFSLSHAVTLAAPQTRGRTEFLAEGLSRGFTMRGGQLLRPVPRSAGVGSNENVADAALRVRVYDRMRRTSGLTLLADDISAGSSIEADTARKLGIDVVVLQAGTEISPWLNRPRVHLLSYGKLIGSAAERAVEWHVQNRWIFLNNDRNRRDRCILNASRLVALRSAWDTLGEEGQALAALRLRTTPSEIAANLSSPAALGILSGEELDSLQAALGVMTPAARMPARELDDDEIDALGRVAASAGIGVVDALSAAMDLLAELTAPGVQRSRMTADLWRDYFRVRGLIS
jgi:hypothetical protein